MNRREFCKSASLASGSIILLPLLNGCGVRQETSLDPATTVPGSMSEMTATPSRSADPAAPTVTSTAEPSPAATMTSPVKETATPQPSPSPNGSRIALVKTVDRAAGVARAIELLGLASLQRADVLLKPNFNSADPAPGSTHPDILEALLVQLTDRDAGQITLADRSGMGNTRQVMEQIGVFDLARGFNCRTMIFDELPEAEWLIFRQPGLHWQDGFPVPRMLLEASAIVQTCNLKTHRYGGHFTLSLKNSVGLVAKTVGAGGHNYMSELHNSPHQRLMIAEINAAYQPDLIVMDGVEAFVNGGPAEGKRVRPGVILAGNDRVAMDAVGVAILRMFGTTPEVSKGRVFEQEQIARAVELGLGAGGPGQIEFVTGDPDSATFADEVAPLLFA